VHVREPSQGRGFTDRFVITVQLFAPKQSDSHEILKNAGSHDHNN